MCFSGGLLRGRSARKDLILECIFSGGVLNGRGARKTNIEIVMLFLASLGLGQLTEKQNRSLNC